MPTSWLLGLLLPGQLRQQLSMGPLQCYQLLVSREGPPFCAEHRPASLLAAHRSTKKRHLDFPGRPGLQGLCSEPMARREEEKTCASGYEHFNKRRKEGEKPKACHGRHSTPCAGRLMPSQSPSNGYFAKTRAPVFIAEHDVTWHGIALWSAGVGCPGSVASQALAHPQPLCSRGQSERQRQLDAL